MLEISYKICCYAICKNESQFVNRFMDAASEADYVCVLDTGSDDGTPNLLRARGAIVGEKRFEPFRFDAARNEALKLIPPDTDICISIDLDEVLRAGWREALERAWTPKTTQGTFRLIWSFFSDGREGGVFYADRLHRNGVFHWIYPVHETLHYDGDAPPVVTEIPGLEVEHRPDPTKSRAQYLPLLELAVSENPENDRCWHYLGREYMYREMWPQAIDALEHHLQIPTATWREERCASMRFLSRCEQKLNHMEKAVNWLLLAIQEAPHLREPYMEFAALLYAAQDWEGLLMTVSDALKITEPRGYICEPFAWGAQPYDYMALAYWNLGSVQEALRFGRQAVEIDPSNPRLRENLRYYEKAAQKSNQGTENSAEEEKDEILENG